MAMSSVVAGSGLMSGVIEKLSALVEQKYMLRQSLQSDIGSLSTELKAMNSALVEVADRGREPDEVQKLLRAELRDLAYDLEDTIDDFVHRLDKSGDGSKLERLVAKPRDLMQKRSLAKELGKYKARAAELRRRWQRLQFKVEDDGVIDLPLSPENPPRHEVLEDAMDPGGLVGMDDSRNEVGRLLIGAGVPETDKLLKVVSVVGFGGIGKTTLATAVYSSIRSQFDCSAFVSMSRSAVAAKVLKCILSQIGEATNGNSDELALINHTRECLRTKRYLIVIDDIRCTSSWEIIRAALPENNRGSRTLITTRIESLAQSCSSNWDDHVYRMSTLSNSHSEELFYRRVFGSEDRCSPQLKQISAKIVKKCGGVPLAILSIAGLLSATPNSKEKWEKVQNHVFWAHEKSPDAETIERILTLSYYSLPDNLKHCLLYLGLFPEDDSIMRDRLVRLWIAEGFVSPGNRASPAALFKMGEAYFNELINRSLIQPVDINYDGGVRACRIHDMILDLITSRAAEENFIAVSANAGNTTVPKVRVRRIALANKGDHHSASERTIDLSSSRYISIFGAVKDKLQPKNLCHLRALELTCCEDLGEKSLTNISELSQLKYLAIRHTRISSLPAQIGLLQSLETLDVRDTCVKELPRSFTKMKKLLHLYVDRVRLPDKIGNVQLWSLGHFDILQSPFAAVQELGCLLNLRVLQIYWAPGLSCSDTDKYGKKLMHSLGKLLHLESLDIDGSCFNVEFLDYYWSPSPDLQRFHIGGGCYLPGVSKWMAFHAHLTYISVNLLEVRMKDLQLLGGIPMLRHLFIWSKQVHAEKLVVKSGQFPCLQRFLLQCPWVYLTFELLAMPRLLNLWLPVHVVTAETNDFSFGIEHLENLRKVEATINGEGADASKTKAAEVAIAKAAHNHPNHPILQITWHSTADRKERKSGRLHLN